MQTTISTDGQLRIPDELRERLGLTRSMEVDIREENGRLVIDPALIGEPVSRVVGAWKSLGKSTDEIMKDLRDRA